MSVELVYCGFKTNIFFFCVCITLAFRRHDHLSNSNTVTVGADELDYEKSKNYWSNVPASVNGMLGGFSCLTNSDIRGSEDFLRKLFRMESGPSNERALDCGAGIGRITDHLLRKHFTCVDLLEQDEKFLDIAKRKFQGTNVDKFYCSGNCVFWFLALLAVINSYNYSNRLISKNKNYSGVSASNFYCFDYLQKQVYSE